MLLYGLLYGMDVISREFRQPFHGIVGRESPVGIHAQFYLLPCETLTDMPHEFQLTLEVYRPDFQFHAVEAQPDAS